MKPIIDCKNVTFGYRPREIILQNVSFEIFKNDFVGIIGPNGGGKSTLLKLLLGLCSPSFGTVQVLEKCPTDHPLEIGYVPQHLNFDRQFPITAFEVVLQGRLKFRNFFSKPSSADIEAAMNALTQVGLAGYKDHLFGTLSGGQIQRILIARALSSQPKILLLDEPTASVDIDAEAAILKLLGELSESMTILMVTHNLRAIIDHVDKLLCVQGKCTLMQPKEVCEHFALGLYHYPLIDTADQHLLQLPRTKQ